MDFLSMLCVKCKSTGHSSNRHTCRFCTIIRDHDSTCHTCSQCSNLGHEGSCDIKVDPIKCEICASNAHDITGHQCFLCSKFGHESYTLNTADMTIINKYTGVEVLVGSINVCINMPVEICDFCCKYKLSSKHIHHCNICDQDGHATLWWCKGCNKITNPVGYCSSRKCAAEKIEFCPMIDKCLVTDCSSYHPSIMHRCPVCKSMKYHRHHNGAYIERWNIEKKELISHNLDPIVSIVESYLYL